MYNDYTAQERRYLDKNGNPVIVAIEYDTSPENPRDYRDDTVLLHFRTHRKYALPQEAGAVQRDQYHVFPVYMYDHSSVVFDLAPFNDRWDSGLAGVVYVEKTFEPSTVKAYAIGRARLKEYEAYVNGEQHVVHIYEVADQFGTLETYDCYSVCFDGTNEDELFKHAEDFYALTPYEEA